jgi:hypothetical protein
MEGFPPIEPGHYLYVITWALIGMCVSATAWSNRREPVLKDYLAGSLGISMEALGVEVAGGRPALVVPLAAALFFALLIRYLSDGRGFRLSNSRASVQRVLASSVVVLGFFWMRVCVLLLAYRGWWDRLILFPGG